MPKLLALSDGVRAVENVNIRGERLPWRRLAAQTGTDQIMLSGGVSSKEFVLANAMEALEALCLKPFCQQLVPTNDGGISLGQVVVAAHTAAAKHS